MLQTVRSVRKLTQQYTEVKFYCTSKNGYNKIIFGPKCLLQTASSYGQKTNDYRKIYFGLGNLPPLFPKIKEKFAGNILLNTPNFFKENQTRKKGRLIAQTVVVTLAASGVILLFRANYISSLHNKQKSSPSSNYSIIKDKIVSFIYGPIEPPQKKGLMYLFKPPEKKNNYSRVFTMLTLVGFQFLLISYFNIPVQLCNIAFSVFYGIYPFSKDPSLFEDMSVYLKKELNKVLPFNLESEHWSYSKQVLQICYEIYKYFK